MNIRRVALGALVAAGAIAAAGYAMFAVAFPTFYTDFMSSGSATGVARSQPLVWPVAVSMLWYGLLVSLAIETRASSVTTLTGMAIGAVVGFLTWATADFMLYGISHVGNLRGTLIDPLLEIVPPAVAGGAVAALFKRLPTESAKPARGTMKPGRAA